MSSLRNAMAAFVQHRMDRSAMNVPAWAKTFGVQPDQIREAWEAAMTVASRKPQNTYGEGEGK